MAGGRGSRLESDREKPLTAVGGRSMIDRVLEAVTESRFEEVFVASSPHTSATGVHVREWASDRPSSVGDRDRTITVLETTGNGYVSDLLDVLEGEQGPSPPVLSVASDLPLLEGAVLDSVHRRYCRERGSPSITVCVPVALKRRLGLSVDSTLEHKPHLAPTGVNVVGTTDQSMTVTKYDSRLATNVNRRRDVQVAETLLTARGGPRGEDGFAEDTGCE